MDGQKEEMEGGEVSLTTTETLFMINTTQKL
jgi:hypothetical protein